MRRPHIPTRIPPLNWRKPAVLWTPAALAVAVGWPALALRDDGPMAQLALIAGATAFAIGLVTLGASWALGRAPRTYRAVILHILAAGAIVAIGAPFVLTELVATVADYKTEGAGQGVSLSSSLAMVPLALLLGLPIALISGMAFAVLALAKRSKRELADDEMFRRHHVQPFT